MRRKIRKSIKINLGCGNKKIKGYMNIDNNKSCNPDILLDLNKGLKGIEDNSVDEIRAEHVLEHVDDLMFMMNEMYRVSNKGAIWDIRVPHYSYGFVHPFHKRGFSYGFFTFFDRNNSESYGDFNLRVNSVRFNYTRMDNLFLKLIAIPINLLANLHKGFCERCWCYIVGGFEEIRFNVSVNKGGK